jgi:hypothetical protein
MELISIIAFISLYKFLDKKQVEEEAVIEGQFEDEISLFF